MQINHPRTKSKSHIEIVYDGDCPICDNYVRHTHLKDHFEIKLINARQNPDIVALEYKKGFELNNGMLVKIDGKSYYGHHAMHVLALASSTGGTWGFLNKILFRFPKANRIAYPLLVYLRKLLLRLLGKTQL